MVVYLHVCSCSSGHRDAFFALKLEEQATVIVNFHLIDHILPSVSAVSCANTKWRIALNMFQPLAPH